MINLYDPETDGLTDVAVGYTKLQCDFCGGKKTVIFAPSGFDIEYPCPRCNKSEASHD